MAPFLFSLFIIFSIAAVGGIGYFDQRLALMQNKTEPPYDQKELLRWTVIFILAQIMIAPAVCFFYGLGHMFCC